MRLVFSLREFWPQSLCETATVRKQKYTLDRARDDLCSEQYQHEKQNRRCARAVRTCRCLPDDALQPQWIPGKGRERSEFVIGLKELRHPDPTRTLRIQVW